MNGMGVAFLYCWHIYVISFKWELQRGMYIKHSKLLALDEQLPIKCHRGQWLSQSEVSSLFVTVSWQQQQNFKPLPLNLWPWWRRICETTHHLSLLTLSTCFCTNKPLYSCTVNSAAGNKWIVWEDQAGEQSKRTHEQRSRPLLHQPVCHTCPQKHQPVSGEGENAGSGWVHRCRKGEPNTSVYTINPNHS